MKSPRGNREREKQGRLEAGAGNGTVTPVVSEARSRHYRVEVTVHHGPRSQEVDEHRSAEVREQMEGAEVKKPTNPLVAIAGTFGGPDWDALQEAILRNRAEE